ncbi:MAG: D-alanyl-D-alanine carboxypeptidase [Candidatus Roizmanbacteria bacterium]|nr:D-alanyl-D-alanine carboxypeptidase [Candidatus Roizmanbacteria bacterium]
MKSKHKVSQSPRYSKAKLYFPQTVVVLLVVFFLMLISLSSTQQTNMKVAGVTTAVSSLDLFTESPTEAPVPPQPPLRIEGSVDPLLTARAALVIDHASGTTLFAKNEDLPLWPASTTKIMTALVALDEYSPDEIVTVQNPVHEGRIMNLLPGERIRVETLVESMLIHSANDAAYALADYHPQGREGFVSRMNQKASELNLVNTHFSDPAGFDDNKQYSTASDMAQLATVAFKNPLVFRSISTASITVSDVDYVTFHRLENVNELLGTVPGVAGGKTGWTENAKENLINITKRNGEEILTVVLGSDDRFGETKTLTDWIFTNFTWPGEEILKSVPTSTLGIQSQELPSDQ